MINFGNDEELFKLYGFKFYRNDKCVLLPEFKVDLKRFKSVANLIEKYGKSSLVSERLILNHIITIRNLFGEFAGIGLFAKTSPEHWDKLKAFLLHLDIIPSGVEAFEKVKPNKDLQEKLRNL